MGKWDFDGDEGFFFLVAWIVGVIGALFWYVNLARRARFAPSGKIRFCLALTPAIAIAGLWLVLTHWADPKYVVGQLDYQLLFVGGGLMWVWFVTLVLPWFGFSAWDDALERSNPAAAVVVCGAMLGAMEIYAGSNVGGGPTIWTTILPAVVATAAWMAMWWIVEGIARPSESIAIDRDLAGGIRHAGFLLAAGLILGRASAGDWTSWQSTFNDMLHLGWPALGLAVATIILGILNRPRAENPEPSVVSAGIVPAAVFILAGVGYLAWLGPADIGKHIVTYEQYMQQK